MGFQFALSVYTDKTIQNGKSLLPIKFPKKTKNQTNEKFFKTLFCIFYCNRCIRT